jgi:hypothetical protein
MRRKFGTIGTSPSYPSTGSPVVVRRISTGGCKVSRAGGVATGESGRVFANCRGSLGGKVCQDWGWGLGARGWGTRQRGAWS